MRRELTLLIGEGTLHAEPQSALADGHTQILISGVVPQEDPSNPTYRTVRFVTTAGTLSV